MSSQTITPSQLFLVFITSTIPRIVGAFLLPNTFGDAYAYTEQVYYMRRELLNGTFSFSSLFGFWLPLYQLICAGISAVIGNPFYVTKVVSAVFGGAVCLLVCLLTRELTNSRSLSFLAAAIVALNPYHFSYSSSAMTDVPHAFFILLCAYCCIKDRWLLASLFALGAGLIRIESWSLILIIPLAQAIGRRRVSLASCLVLISGPLCWLFVSWKATGNVTRYFEIRNDYIVQTLASSPWLTSFTPDRVSFDTLRFIYTANPVVLFACFALLATVIRLTAGINQRLATISEALVQLLTTAPGIILTFYFSHLAFLVLAYLTGNQPEIWPRYGLIFFALGLPILAAQLPQIKKRGVLYVSAVMFALQFSVQLVDVTRITIKSDLNFTAAEFLEDERMADGSVKVYCEDGAIRVLSGIPLEEFRNQYNSPADTNGFLESLKDEQVRLLVYKDLPGSRLREIISRVRAHPGTSGITLEEVPLKPRKKPEDTIVVYRIHGPDIAKSRKKSRAL